MELAQNIRNVWTVEVSKNNGCVIVSPYVSDFLVQVISLNAKNVKCIYTRFDLLEFYQGSSNIEVLVNLSEMGIEIRAIKNLHAKIFLSKDLATIGSQNATTNSECLFELSFITRCSKEVRKIRREIKEQLNSSKVIPQELLIEVKAKLAEFGNQEKISANIINAHIKLTNQLFDNALQYFMVDQLMQNSLLTQLEEQTTPEHFPSKKFNQKNEYYIKRCVLQDGASEFKHYNVLAKHQEDLYLTQWQKVGCSQRDLYLDAMYRYLIVNNVTGQLGWAKVASTRINFIGEGVYSQGGQIKYCNSVFEVELSSITKQRGNMEIKLTSVRSNSYVTLSVRFNLFEMKLTKRPKFKEDKAEPFAEEFFSEKKFAALLKRLSKLATNKFKYEKNNSGLHINEYFKDLPKHSRLLLREIDKNPVLFIDY